MQRNLIILIAAGAVIAMIATGHGSELMRSVGRGVGYSVGHEAVRSVMHH